MQGGLDGGAEGHDSVGRAFSLRLCRARRAPASGNACHVRARDNETDVQVGAQLGSSQPLKASSFAPLPRGPRAPRGGAGAGRNNATGNPGGRRRPGAASARETTPGGPPVYRMTDFISLDEIPVEPLAREVGRPLARPRRARRRLARTPARTRGARPGGTPARPAAPARRAAGRAPRRPAPRRAVAAWAAARGVGECLHARCEAFQCQQQRHVLVQRPHHFDACKRGANLKMQLAVVQVVTLSAQLNPVHNSQHRCLGPTRTPVVSGTAASRLRLRVTAHRCVTAGSGGVVRVWGGRVLLARGRCS